MRRRLIILSASFGATLLAGCGGDAVSPSGRLEAQGLTASRSTLSTRSATKGSVYHLLYSFTGYAENDGANPWAGLTDVNGTLYGTTFYGGLENYGTVFKITPFGSESIVHSFGQVPDAEYPVSALTDVNGTLYGTAASGGTTGGYGTLYRVTPSGKEHVLLSFAFQGGAAPYSGLLDIHGTLYGTTEGGGGYGGTVYGFDPKTKTFSLFYGFKGGSDGAEPWGGLIDVNAQLYGTTSAGGSGGAGTVFKINRSSQNEKVLYSFAFPPKTGGNPRAGLADVNGTFYGTTENGGANESGTVFSITTSGSESVLHTFGGANDGQTPLAGLLYVNGALYGTTSVGGQYGYGTVFKITPSGKERVLYSFKGPYVSDGANPQAGVIEVNGTLYGTTRLGGKYGYGTVYSLTL